LVATFPPGGLADTIGRLVAPALGAALGQSVVIDNRAGAGGTIGADLVAKSPPDGYTLVISHASPHGFAPGIYPQLPYDPVADFTHLGMLVDTPSALLVTGKSPLLSLDDLLAAARRGGVRYGSSGVGSSGHLLGEVLAKDARAPRLDHVPYRGSAPGLQDLMAGAIESLIDPLTTNMGMLRDGSLRALAVTTARRLPALPGVPAFEELGYPRLTAGVWIGCPARAGCRRRSRSGSPRRSRRSCPARICGSASTSWRAPPPEPPLLGAEYARYVAEFAKLWTGVAREANITAS
jgi:tripartite-type tricarboxylate transporter receptor subunit TctC